MTVHDVALAYSLSTVAGLRAALTIAVVSAAVHAHWLTVPASAGWVGSDTVLVVAIVFAIADFFGDKIPVVDHALHAVHTVLAPLAGAAVGAATDPAGPVTPAIVTAAAVNALGVHALRSAARVGTTAVSLGALTPVVSLVEDGVALVGLALAFVAPVAVAAAALAATLVAVLVVRRLVRRRRRTSAS